MAFDKLLEKLQEPKIRSSMARALGGAEISQEVKSMEERCNSKRSCRESCVGRFRGW